MVAVVVGLEAAGRQPVSQLRRESAGRGEIDTAVIVTADPGADLVKAFFRFFRDDIDYAPHGLVAIKGAGGSGQHFDAGNFLQRHVVQIGGCGIAVVETATVDQYQRIGVGSRGEAAHADVNLAAVAEQVVDLYTGNTAQYLACRARAAGGYILGGNYVNRSARSIFRLFGPGRCNNDGAEISLDVGYCHSQAQASQQGTQAFHVVLHEFRETHTVGENGAPRQAVRAATRSSGLVKSLSGRSPDLEAEYRLPYRCGGSIRISRISRFSRHART